MSDEIPPEPDVAHLSDDELREYARHWSNRYDEHLARAEQAPDEATRQREEYSAWWCSKKEASAERDAQRRGFTTRGDTA